MPRSEHHRCLKPLASLFSFRNRTFSLPSSLNGFQTCVTGCHCNRVTRKAYLLDQTGPVGAMLHRISTTTKSTHWHTAANHFADRLGLVWCCSSLSTNLLQRGNLSLLHQRSSNAPSWSQISRRPSWAFYWRDAVHVAATGSTMIHAISPAQRPAKISRTESAVIECCR